MKKAVILLALLAAIPLFAFQTSQITVILGPTLIDGTGRPALKNAAIVIENGKIRDIGPRGNVRIPSNAKTIDARDKWVIPGLPICRVHRSSSHSTESARCPAARYRESSRSR